MYSFLILILLLVVIVHYRSVCECWRGLVTDSSLAADVLDQFLRLGSSTPLVEENTTKSPSRPPVATHLPLAVSSLLPFNICFYYFLIGKHHFFIQYILDEISCFLCWRISVCFELWMLVLLNKYVYGQTFIVRHLSFAKYYNFIFYLSLHAQTLRY